MTPTPTHSFLRQNPGYSKAPRTAVRGPKISELVRVVTEIGIVRGPCGKAERRLSTLCMRAREPQKRLKAGQETLCVSAGTFLGTELLVGSSLAET